MFINEQKLKAMFAAYIAVMIAMTIFSFALPYLFIDNFQSQLYTVIAAITVALMVILSIITYLTLTKHIRKQLLLPFQRLLMILEKLSSEASSTEEIMPLAKEHAKILELIKKLNKRLKTNAKDMKILNSYISHEIKNSISVLSAMVQLDSDRQEILQYIQHMNVSIENILALSEVKNVKTNEQTDLCLVCAMVVDNYRKKYKHILLTIPDEGTARVKGRENLFYRAISNLVDNAIKYGNGSQITVTVKEEKNSVIVCVHNFGAPIDQTHLDFIFSSDYRITSLKKNSYGIGLSLVKNVMDICQGALWIDSTAEKGTSFYLSVPLY